MRSSWHLLFYTYTLLLGLPLSPLTAYVQFEVQTREWLTNTYLPSLFGHVLYVGVGEYTTKYHLLTKNPEFFETIDYDAAKASYGSPYGHYVIDFLEFTPPYQYDHICLYGVFGLPAITPTSLYSFTEDGVIKQAIDHAHKLLKVGGTLQLGPNYNVVPGQDLDFWLGLFSSLLSDKYELLFLGVGPNQDNIVWWGKKRKE